MSFEVTRDNKILDKIKKLDITTITPIEAMNFLYDISKIINGE